MSATLLTLKETAMRIGELCSVKWTNINVKNCTITCNQPEKNSNPRIFKVSTKLIGMIQALPHYCEKVFGALTKTSKEWNFNIQKKRLAKKLNNPRLKEIKFHTFRHWKATVEYHKTRALGMQKNSLDTKTCRTLNSTFTSRKPYLTRKAQNIT